jgi:hypothetical protein
MKKYEGNSGLTARNVEVGEVFAGTFLKVIDLGKIGDNESASIKGAFLCSDGAGGAAEAHIWFPAALQKAAREGFFLADSHFLIQNKGLVKGKKGKYYTYDMYELSQAEYDSIFSEIKAGGVVSAKVFDNVTK